MISPHTIERLSLLKEAISWERTPYHHNQALKGIAADCIRFVEGVFVAAGFAEPYGPAEYPPDWHLHRNEELLLNAIEQQCIEVCVPLPTDIAVFRLGRCFSHAAIVTAWPCVIHAWKPAGCVVRDDISKMQRLLWLNDGVPRPRRFYRLRRWCD